MNCTILPVVLLAFATLGASAPLYAQARGPVREMRDTETPVETPQPVQDEATRARMFAEAQAWLGRLVGTFEVDEREIRPGGLQDSNGTAVCNPIGSGPGVQCSFHMLGAGTSRTGATLGPGFEHFTQDGIRTPAKKTSHLMFFGIKPETLEIQLVLVDQELATAQSGVVTGDAVDFADNWNVCYRAWAHCWMPAAITASPAGEIVIKLSRDNYGSFRKHSLTTKSGHTADLEWRLRREPPVDTNGPP